jgi:CubicO group peptidase (beta-lactamase class C family)
MSGGFSRPRLARLSDRMRRYVDSGALPGLVALVARGAHVHVEALGVADLATGRPMARDSVFRLASVTKPLAAVAAMTLVEDGTLRLDDPVDGFLPELADRRVLTRLEAPLTDTAAAQRPITLRDLLTFRMGFGALFGPPGAYPIQQAQAEAQVGPGPIGPELTPDEYMRRLGALPLMEQPGTVWRYHTGLDVAGVLVARASGLSLPDVMRRRIFEPLGMGDTGFGAAPGALDRLTTLYACDPAGALRVYDGRDGRWSRPPMFPSGGAGLVSTADDLLAFGRMMLAMGQAGPERILARPTVELMTTDQITAAQKAVSSFSPGFWDTQGWGLGMSVTTARKGIADTPGRYGWIGGTGTLWYNDPREDVVAVFLSPRMMQSPDDTGPADDFLTLAYQAFED